MNCVFCSIVKKEQKAEIFYEDDIAVAIWDINPQAPVHFLVLPRNHIPTLREGENAETLGKLLQIASKIALEHNLDAGYRIVINDGSQAGQSVYHLHLHVIGGRPLKWPPG